MTFIVTGKMDSNHAVTLEGAAKKPNELLPSKITDDTLLGLISQHKAPSIIKGTCEGAGGCSSRLMLALGLE